MGRIKTQLVKRTTVKLYREHKDEFKSDFAANKEVVSKLLATDSKKMINVIAGYITRLVKKSAE